MFTSIFDVIVDGVGVGFVDFGSCVGLVFEIDVDVGVEIVCDVDVDLDVHVRIHVDLIRNILVCASIGVLVDIDLNVVVV